MASSESRLSSRQIKSLLQQPRTAPLSGAQDDARWKNLASRTLGAATGPSDLAYGCVDWYLYNGETLRSVSF